MSGGHFDYNQSLISEIADTIAIEIARALLPKPKKVHEDYWTIDEHDCPCSCHNYSGYREFKTYEEAESFLLWDKSIVPADHNYGISHIPKEDKVFRSTKLLMGGTKDADPIPWLYTIHHCVFDHYPYDADVLELNEETIETMKQAYLQLRKAYVYAQRVDWMLSGDDGEDTMQMRLKEELDAVQQEFDNKDWTCPYEGWNEDELEKAEPSGPVH